MFSNQYLAAVCRHDNPLWTGDIKRILGAYPAAFTGLPASESVPLPGKWWRATIDGSTVGFAWITVDDDAGDDSLVWQIQIAVEELWRYQGIGRTLLEHVRPAAVDEGVAAILSVVKFENEDRTDVIRWAKKNGVNLRAGMDPGARFANGKDVILELMIAPNGKLDSWDSLHSL
jgi:GNAT superfamily N-acetyltransferase